MQVCSNEGILAVINDRGTLPLEGNSQMVRWAGSIAQLLHKSKEVAIC